MSSHRPTEPRARTPDDLDRIADEIGRSCTRDHAAHVRREILGRANSDIRDPLGYVLKAITDEPNRYRPVPVPHRPTECDHGVPTGHRCDRCGVF